MKEVIINYPSVSPSLELVCLSGMCGWRVLHMNRSETDGISRETQVRKKVLTAF